jgi:hypothetical protein
MAEIPKDTMHASHAFHICGKGNNMRMKRYNAYMIANNMVWYIAILQNFRRIQEILLARVVGMSLKCGTLHVDLFRNFLLYKSISSIWLGQV